MSLQKMLDHILESWLPTKLTILIAGSTILLVLLAIGLPEYLQKIGILLSAERKLLLRLIVPLTLLCLGLFVVLLLVLKHSKSSKEQISKLEHDIENIRESQSKELMKKPNFKPYSHNAEKGYWQHNQTGERICAACKLDEVFSPLHSYRDGWRCPKHEKLVGREDAEPAPPTGVNYHMK